ncbi:MAG: hypothetical protein SNJ63_05430 [Sphingomonadaceae bacterium]
MKRLPCSAALVALSLAALPPAAAQTVPEPVKARVNEMVATCLAAGGRFGDRPGPNRFAVPRDFNGDGRTDFLVAEGAFPCDGRPDLFRPGNMARLQLWLGDGAGGARLAFDERVSGHRIIEGRPASVIIARLGAPCGKGIARCEDRLQFSGAGLALVPADGRPGGPVPVRVAAAPPPAAVAARPAPAQGAGGAKAASLPLRRGYFVATDTPCNRASNATVNLMTGDGMNASRTICTFEKVEPQGSGRFRVTQSCQELGGWGHESPPEVSTVIFEIPDDSRFSVRWEGGSVSSSRYCPQASMNEPFRTNDISDLLR